MSHGSEKVNSLPAFLAHCDALFPLLQAASALALLTDVDGTIGPIAPTPESAIVTPRCREALRLLAERLPLVAAVSGRSASQARQMVGLDSVVYLGNHGLDRWPPSPHSVLNTQSSVLDAVLAELSARLSGLMGIILEDKGPVLAVHYRLAPNPDEARAQVLAIAGEVAARYGLKATEGRRVVELLPRVEVNKGTAIHELLDEHPALRAALYLGDDRTDADAFLAVHRWAERGDRVGLAVAVLSPETPPEVERHADYALNGVPEVEQFLEWLANLALRQAGS